MTIDDRLAAALPCECRIDPRATSTDVHGANCPARSRPAVAAAVRPSAEEILALIDREADRAVERVIRPSFTPHQAIRDAIHDALVSTVAALGML